MKHQLVERGQAIASAARRKLAEDRKALEAIRNGQKPSSAQKASASK